MAGTPVLPGPSAVTRAFGWCALAAVTVAVPWWSHASFVTQVSSVVGFTVSFAGLVVLTNHLGLVSLGQGALTGIGAVAALHSVNDFGLPVMAMPLVGLAAGFAVGALFGVISLRLPIPYLAVATFALAVAYPIVIRQIDGPLPKLLDGEFVPPSWTGIDPRDEHIWEYWIMVVWALAALLLLRRLLTGPVGRAMLATRDDPQGAAAYGIAVQRIRIAGVALSGALAGLGGALIVIAINFTGPRSPFEDQYPVELSIKMFALAMAIRGTRMWGALPAAIVLVMLPEWLDDRSWPAIIGWDGLFRSEGFFYAVLLIATAHLTKGQGFGHLVTDRLNRRRDPHREVESERATSGTF